MIPVRRLAHAVFATPDIDRQVAHFTQVVGLALGAREKDRAILVTRLGEEVLVLERGAKPGCIRLAFQVSPDFDLGDASRELANLGIRSERKSDLSPAIADTLVFKDPQGMTVELFARCNYGPAQPVAGVGPLKVGHVALVVPDAKTLTDFYVKHLGFRVSDWMEDFFVFLRCGPDHHTCNFVTHGNPVAMHHLAFETKDWAHVQVACETLGKFNKPIIWGPGRHGIGHNVFVYHRDPDDNIIEFYTELDQMKDEELGYWDPRPWHRERPLRPKTWDIETGSLIWGAPPTADFLRGGTRESPEVRKAS